MAGEVLLVAEGDEILTAGGVLPPEAAALRAAAERGPGPPPAGLEQRPDERVPLTFHRRPFTLPTTLDACHGALRSVFAVHGRRGVDDFFAENGMVPRRVGRGEQVDLQLPEELLGPTVPLYRLLREARRRVLARADDLVPLVEAAAQASGLGRLASSREEVASEAVRYFRGVDDTTEAAALLDSDQPGHAHLFDPTRTAVAGLRAELAALRPFLGRAADARERLHEERTRRLVAQEGNRPTTVRALEGREFAELARLRETMARIDADPVVARVAARDREARDAIVERVAIAATAHPVVWRVYASSDGTDAAALGVEVLAELRATWGANRSLHDDLTGSPGRVWELPPLVRSALTDAGIGLLSIASTAAEERLADAAGAGTAAVVATASGLAHLGLTGLAALAGAGALAPPIGITLTFVEVVASLADAVEEYRRYRLQSAAFRACLDPHDALAVEPSLLSAVLTIGFDLLSLLPAAPAARTAP